MPAAITSSANPFADVVDARDFTRAADKRDHAAESRRFADALDASRREPSKKLERLPPDEPLADKGFDKLPARSDDVALRHDRLTTLQPQQQKPESSSPSSSSSSSSPDKTADKGRESAIERGRRLRDGAGVHSSGRIVHSANAPTAPTASTKNAAAADALFDAVQRHVHSSVHREAAAAERRTEKLSDVFSEKLKLDDDKKLGDVSAPVETETARSVEAVVDTSTTMTTSADGAPPPVDVGGPRESAALDHVQQLLEDPASQLFFDGRRAVISLDGMTMRVSTNAEGQTSVELRATDAAVAERLQSARGELVEGLQHEGLAPAAIDFGHETSSSSFDRQQQREADDVDVDDLPWRRAAVKRTTSAAPTTSRGIKA